MKYFEKFTLRVKEIFGIEYDELKPTVDLHFMDNSELYNKFVTDYNPIVHRVCSGNWEKYCFDVGDVTINGIRIHVLGPHYVNPNFDKEECMRRCAQRKEEYHIIEEHFDEKNVEARLKRIIEKKETGCDC